MLRPVSDFFVVGKRERACVGSLLLGNRRIIFKLSLDDINFFWFLSSQDTSRILQVFDENQYGLRY